MKRSRREFIQSGVTIFGAAAAGLSLGGALHAAGNAPAASEEAVLLMPPPHTKRRGDMPYRMLGSTGEEVSLVGLGGYHIGTQDDEAESIRIIHKAIDHGVNFLDNSWDYNGGRSEIRMGKALKQSGYRKKVFLMTKVDGRSKVSAARQLDESLQRLQADHIDLLQFHEVVRTEDPGLVFAKGGAIEAAIAAKKAGKIRYIGFTGHKDPKIHRHMLELADQHGFHFDTVQMPVNIMDAHFRSFTHEIIPMAVHKKIGVLAMKTFGGGVILQRTRQENLATPIEMLHYSMTMPVSVVITGMDSPEILQQALDAARTYHPLSRQQMAALLAKSRPAALGGSSELFKTTHYFDTSANRPELFE